MHEDTRATGVCEWALADHFDKRGRARLRQWCEHADVRVAVARHARSGARLWPPPKCRPIATGGGFDHEHDPGDESQRTCGADANTPVKHIKTAVERPYFPLDCGFERGFEIGAAWARRMGRHGRKGVPTDRLALARWWLEFAYGLPGHSELREDGRWWCFEVTAPLWAIPGQADVPAWIRALPNNRPARDRMPCGLAALRYAEDMDFVADIEFDPPAETPNSGLCRQRWRVRDFRSRWTPLVPTDPTAGERVPLRRAA